MPRICFYIPMDSYLAQWFINDMGGDYPVSLKRGSVERKFVELYIDKQPEGATPSLPGEGMVAIEVPSIRGKYTESYCYLDPKYIPTLIDLIRDRFDVELWQDLHHFGRIGKRRDNLIRAWMAKHGIADEGSHWDTIAKRYQRQRDIYMMRKRAENQYKRKCSKKSH